MSLGYTNIGNNAKGNQGSAGTIGVGINSGTGLADTGSSTNDASEPTSDTQVMAFDGQGTVVSNGING